jgi:hypothetical protein
MLRHMPPACSIADRGRPEQVRDCERRPWRPGGESNSRWGICSPLHYHFATRPCAPRSAGRRAPQATGPARGGQRRERRGSVSVQKFSIDLGNAAFLHGQPIFAFVPTSRVSAAPGGADLRLLPEPGHRLRVCPARAGQHVVMLVPVLLEPAPHMAVDLMTTEHARSGHVMSLLVRRRARAARRPDRA